MLAQEPLQLWVRLQPSGSGARHHEELNAALSQLGDVGPVFGQELDHRIGGQEAPDDLATRDETPDASACTPAVPVARPARMSYIRQLSVAARSR